MTEACGRVCAASVGLLVTKEKREKKKGQLTKKNTVGGDTGNYKGDVWGGGAVSMSYISG